MRHTLTHLLWLAFPPSSRRSLYFEFSEKLLVCKWWCVVEKCIINLVLGSLVFICLFYLLDNWHSDNTRVLCTHLHYQCTQATHVTVYSLALSVHSGNTCYCVHTYTISALRQYMLLCTHLHSQYTRTIHVFSVLLFTMHSNNTCVLCPYTPNRNKGKGNGAGLAWESQSHCFADEFGITHAHSIGADTQHD